MRLHAAAIRRRLHARRMRLGAGAIRRPALCRHLPPLTATTTGPAIGTTRCATPSRWPTPTPWQHSTPAGHPSPSVPRGLSSSTARATRYTAFCTLTQPRPDPATSQETTMARQIIIAISADDEGRVALTTNLPRPVPPLPPGRRWAAPFPPPPPPNPPPSPPAPPPPLPPPLHRRPPWPARSSLPFPPTTRAVLP